MSRTPFDWVFDVVKGDYSAEFAKEQIRIWLDAQSDKAERSRNSCAYRFCRALADVHAGRKDLSSWADVAGHLRQVILMFSQRLRLSKEITDQLYPMQQKFGLRISDDGDVDASEEYPTWLAHGDTINDVFRLPRRRFDHKAIGDGILYQMTGFPTYASTEQKALVHTSVLLPDGFTLLASLPTGGGKSLVGQLPAFYETSGGRIHGGVDRAGVTVVVVPTVALALDQLRIARRYFEHARGEEYFPQAYTGDLPEEQKKFIFQCLQKGSLPLLFTSPEALLQGRLSEALMHAAEAGKLNRLVIDEAHIVVDWGNAFRTDFQLLSVLRRKLLQATNGRLRTVILSATLTEASSEILRDLFAEEGKLVEMRCDALRMEPSYFVDLPKSIEERKQRILELLPLLPRPIILYVSTLEQASSWGSALAETGYRSHAMFTGETTDQERHRLIDAWNRDQVDIMIATSAFGMGVDKPDIRTVLHCCLPESINRFYQEVGRGGRDGFMSISLLSTVLPEDERIAFSLINKQVLKASKMAERWESLLKGDFISGDEVWMDTNKRPSYLQGQLTGRQSASWNEVLLLFLFRKGLVDILDIRREEQSDLRKMLVRIHDIDRLMNPKLVEEELEPMRENEWQQIRHEFERMVELVKEVNHECILDRLLSLYPYARVGCGGCPACRIKGYEVFQAEGRVEVFGYDLMHDALPEASGLLLEYLGKNEDLLLTIPQHDMEQGEKTIQIIKLLAQLGVRQFVVPTFGGGLDWQRWVTQLPYENVDPYAIYTFTMVQQAEDTFPLSGKLVIFYPREESKSGEVYLWTREYLRQHGGNQVIHIAPRKWYVASERKDLLDLLDGIVYPIESLLEPLFDEEESIG